MPNKRMEILFSLIPENNTVIADIGCDHGYLVNMLAQSNKAKLVVASDISLPSLEKAKKNFDTKKASTEVKFIHSNGLDNYIDIKPDCVIIAGMGGKEIEKILSNAKNDIKTIILQPMHDQEDLRIFLANHFFIQKDFYVKIHNRFYNFILAHMGKDTLSNSQIICGKTSFLDAPLDFKEFLDYNIKRYQNYLLASKEETTTLILKEKLEVLVRAKEQYYE